MDAPAGSLPNKKRRWPRLQFSLRFLLVAFTACAIGFPIWYRWPFTEETVQYPMVGGKPDKTKPPIRKTTVTWQRTWGGGKTRQGPLIREYPGNYRLVEEYRNNVKSGPYLESYKGVVIVSGQFASGKRTGQWINRSDKGVVTARTTWKEGRLDGPAELSQASNGVNRVMFTAGALAEIDGRPATKLWPRVARAIESDSPRFATIFSEEASMEFVSTPLKDALQIICDAHNISAGRLRIDQATVDAKTLITMRVSNIGLLQSLAVLTESCGMCCDYRYGCVWVIKHDDCKQWSDPTGIDSLQPNAGTLLAGAWSEPVTINTIGATTTKQPLGTILKSLASQVALEIDAAQIEASPDHPQDYSTVLYLDKMPFHQALGVLLYETGCRCKLEGDKLIVMPQEVATLPEK